MESEESIKSLPHSLNEFTFIKVLNFLPDYNTVICLADGKIDEKQEKALIWLKKALFDEKKASEYFTGSESNPSLEPVKLTSLLQHNDKFFNYLGECNPSMNPLFIKLIFPATEKDIEKVIFYFYLFLFVFYNFFKSTLLIPWKL